MRYRPLAWGAVGGGAAGLAVLTALLWFRTAPLPEGAQGRASGAGAPVTASAPAMPRSTTALPGPTPALTDVPCWFPLPAGREARCGILTVPETWAAPGSRLLKLHFVVLRGAVGGSAPPLVYLPGGPGEPARIDAQGIGEWWDWLARADWLRQRDLVIFDPRGVGLSEPNMNCPELGDAAYRAFVQPLGLERENALWAEAARRCYERLAASGIDLASYNTSAMVEDLRSLIGQLGYRSWDLLATSYGTRVALRFIDRWRLGTRAIVLDSVYPPDVTAYVDSGPAAARVFTSLFRECDADKACHTAFPAIAKRFEAIVRRAAANPITVELADPRGGSPLKARLDDGKLVDALFFAFYDWHRIAELPAIITALDAGDTRPLARLAGLAFDNYVSTAVSHGLFLSVECHDEFPFNRQDAVDQAAAELPLYRSFALSNLPLAACPSWPVGQATAEERRPVASDVAALILSGELDPMTPESWAKSAARSLPHAVTLEFRGIGHGVLAAHGCAGVIVGRFLANPARPPLDDCLLAVGAPHFHGAAPGG
jgi:pimeloyl-ACP methyl ester carboxylesterase